MTIKRDFTLRFEQRGEIVYAYTETKEELVAPYHHHYLDRIAEHCADCACGRILIERHFPEPFSVWDAFQIGPTLAKIGHDLLMVAVAEMDVEPSAKRELTVAIGKDRCLSVKIFTGVHEAQKWITDCPNLRTVEECDRELEIARDLDAAERLERAVREEESSDASA